jgi:hypothetical protein
MYIKFLQQNQKRLRTINAKSFSFDIYRCIYTQIQQAWILILSGLSITKVSSPDVLFSSWKKEAENRFPYSTNETKTNFNYNGIAFRTNIDDNNDRNSSPIQSTVLTTLYRRYSKGKNQ